VHLDVNLKNERRAEIGLKMKVADVSRTVDLAELGIQGDETNAAIDLLTVLPGTRPDQLHPYFVELIEQPRRGPARAVHALPRSL
jgi:hypothetical protein